jgi:hypothetical protein
MSPDLNPIENIWDMLSRRMQARGPPVQNIRQLEAALHREWQQLSQQDIRRLTGGMICRIEAVIQARGGYTRCCLSTGMLANNIRLTKRCNALSSRSDIIRGLPDLGKSFTLLVCVFSHQSADYSIVIAHLTSNSFEGHPVIYMPIICHLCASDIRLRTMLTENE